MVDASDEMCVVGFDVAQDQWPHRVPGIVDAYFETVRKLRPCLEAGTLQHDDCLVDKGLPQYHSVPVRGMYTMPLHCTQHTIHIQLYSMDHYVCTSTLYTRASM